MKTSAQKWRKNESQKNVKTISFRNEETKSFMKVWKYENNRNRD